MKKVIVIEGIGHPEIRGMIEYFTGEKESVYLLLSEKEKEQVCNKGTCCLSLPSDMAGENGENNLHLYTYGADYTGTVRALYEKLVAGEGKVDILAYAPCAHAREDGTVEEGHSCEEIYAAIEKNVMDFRILADTMIPLMKQSEIRRIMVVTEKNASIRCNTAENDYGYHLSLAAVNMAEKIYFNLLRKEGFTFRCYAGCGGEEEMHASSYVVCGLSNNPDEPPVHSDENRLVMRDSLYEEIAW